MEKKIGICYFRSLYSQSACSLSVGKLSDYLLNIGYDTRLFLLKNNDVNFLVSDIDQIMNCDTIIYKVNYKDFEYGIRFFDNLLSHSNKKLYLIGPFAIMNKKEILKKYSFIDGIINIEDSIEIDFYFPRLRKSLNKNTIVCGIDREIEYLEKGKYINLEASSGCIYNCEFCHIKLMNYNKFEKNINLLIDEIDCLVNKMGKKYLIFNDSLFWKNLNDNDRIEQFIKLIKQKN